MGHLQNARRKEQPWDPGLKVDSIVTFIFRERERERGQSNFTQITPHPLTPLLNKTDKYKRFVSMCTKGNNNKLMNNPIDIPCTQRKKTSC